MSVWRQGTSLPSMIASTTPWASCRWLCTAFHCHRTAGSAGHILDAQQLSADPTDSVEFLGWLEWLGSKETALKMGMCVRLVLQCQQMCCPYVTSTIINHQEPRLTIRFGCENIGFFSCAAPVLRLFPPGLLPQGRFPAEHDYWRLCGLSIKCSEWVNINKTICLPCKYVDMCLISGSCMFIVIRYIIYVI